MLRTLLKIAFSCSIKYRTDKPEPCTLRSGHMQSESACCPAQHTFSGQSWVHASSIDCADADKVIEAAEPTW